MKIAIVSELRREQIEVDKVVFEDWDGSGGESRLSQKPFIRIRGWRRNRLDCSSGRRRWNNGGGEDAVLVDAALSPREAGLFTSFASVAEQQNVACHEFTTEYSETKNRFVVRFLN